jgi:superfamily II DNA/RNA helicase
VEIGLYSSSSSSKLFENGKAKTTNRELLKEKVTLGRLKLLIGTDAASTGLNLQQLGGLINLDLPWNPTVLEQRKGRVQRGTIGKRVPFYNMRFDQGAEARLFEVLSGRIEEITNVFGAVPDFIVDEWVNEKLRGKELTREEIITRVEERKTNPFQVKETNEFLLEDWDATAEVLNEHVQLREFRKPW